VVAEIDFLHFEHMDNPQPPALPEAPTQTPEAAPSKPPVTKKDEVLGCGCLIIVALGVMMLLKSCFFGGSIDLSDPPAAIDKLAREALASAEGFEYIKVEKTGPNQDGYFVNISYRSPGDFIGGEKGSFARIKRDMNSAYKAILAYPELAVVHLKINAQLELKDSYGNTAWVDVYRTRLEEEAIGKLNRKNLDLVDFEGIWDAVFIAKIFWPYDDKQTR
jgi:hypothetical protein